MKLFILILLLFVSGSLLLVTVSCETQPRQDFVFDEAQIQWLKDHHLYDRVKDIPVEKKREIAEIINTELDLQRELDSLATEFPGLNLYLNDKRLGLHQ